MKANQVSRDNKPNSKDIPDDTNSLASGVYIHGYILEGGYNYTVKEAQKLFPTRTHNILMRDSSNYAILYATENNLFS
jgi:hypothetical protein